MSIHVTCRHTPGPWAFNRTDRGEYIVFDEQRRPLDRQICYTGTAYPHDEANARLIAAAPKLLMALQCALADLEGSKQAFEQGDINIHDWKAHNLSIDETREAIAEATGREAT